MNKRAFRILLIALIVLTVSFFLIWQFEKPDVSQMEQLYLNSTESALDSFRQYRDSGSESSYWDGVAEFRCMMKAYLILQGSSTPDYLSCNVVYGEMLHDPENVKENISSLIEALDLLIQEDTRMTGFLRIYELRNLLLY